MNIFKSLKNKLSGVQNEIKKSFHVFRSSSKGVPSLTEEFGNKVEIDCGSSLLDKYQNVWSDIHGSILESAKAAENVDKTIAELHIVHERQDEAFEEFNKNLRFLDGMIKDMEQAKVAMDSIEVTMINVEEMLIELHKQVTEQELERKKKESLHQLEVLKRKKRLDIEKCKVQLALQHSDRVKMHEAKIQANLHTRQEAFEETYNEGIEKYKKSGQVPSEMLSKSLKTRGEEELANVNFDEDNSALEEFLGPEELQEDFPSVEEEVEEEENADETEVMESQGLQTVNDPASFQQYLSLTSSVTPELESSGDATRDPPVLCSDKNILPNTDKES